MKLLVSSILILLAVTVAAQERPQLLHVDYFGGLNTRSGNFQMKPGEARIAHNVDFGRNIGALTKRKGYELARTVSTMDSLIAIYGAFFSDGTQRMFMVSDKNTDNYGRVLATPRGNLAGAAQEIWDYFSIQGEPSFAMIDDKVYIVNGRHKGLVIMDDEDGLVVRSYPLQAPGEPLIYPIPDGNQLNGEYRYMFRGSGARSNSVISSAIKVDSGQVLLTGFQKVIPDSLVSDSAIIYVYRSKANLGPLDLTDTAYYTHLSFWVRPGVNYADSVWIDTCHDTALSTTKKYPFIEPGAWSGRDSTGNLGRRYGSPAFVSSDSTTPSGGGIFAGWPFKQKDTLGVAYACTFIDTIFGIESDTGRSLFVFCDSGNHSPSFKQVTLRIPRIPDGVSGIVINLYRACIVQLGHDTSWVDTTYWPSSAEMECAYLRNAQPEAYEICLRLHGYKKIRTTEYQERFIPESTVVLGYHLLAQLSSDDTLYTDSISYDSLKNARQYRSGTPPPLLKKIFAADGRLFGLQASGLYYSDPIYADVNQTWGRMALTPVNPGDGDAVTTAWPERGVIRVLKSRSSFNIFQDDMLNWTKTEVSGVHGCIAEHGYARGLLGHYFLSALGVIRENEGLSLERSQTSELVSKTLDNFSKLPIATSRKTRAFAIPSEGKVLFCIGDTTYVYDELADAWSTWSMTFRSATLYQDEENVELVPGDTMYFTKPNDYRIYKYGGVETDQGNTISMIWKSGPLLIGPEYKSITNVGLWRQGGGVADTILVALFNESDQSIQTCYFDSLHQAYSVMGIAPNNVLFSSIYITNGTAFPWQWDIDDIAIDGLDIWYTKAGDVIIK